MTTRVVSTVERATLAEASAELRRHEVAHQDSIPLAGEAIWCEIATPCGFGLRCEICKRVVVAEAC